VLGGCVSEKHLPYQSWYLAFRTEPNVQVWMESAQIEDVAGRHFSGYEVGAIGSDKFNPAAKGWPSGYVHGKGKYVVGAALPTRIYVRWQSLVEPQTYSVTLDIPDTVRRKMLTEGPPDPNPGQGRPNSDWRYYNNMVISLAPGGMVKVWLNGVVTTSIPVMCVKAHVEPLGPDLGKYGGEYVTLSPKLKEYLKQHPIPYDSWKCDEP